MFDFWYDIHQMLKNMENPPLWEEKVVDKYTSKEYNTANFKNQFFNIKQPVSKAGFKRGQRK